MSLWRNRALSSKFSLASRARTSPLSVTIRGLISASEASVSRKKRTNALRNFSPFLARLALQAEGLADLAGLEVGQAEADVDRLAVDLLGRLVGDDLDLDAPLGRGHQDRALQAPVDGQAEVELAGDVVADGDQHLRDRLPLGAGLVGDQGLAEQARRRPCGVLLRPDELDALGHPVVAGLQAAGDLQGLAPVVVGADGDPLAAAAGVDLGLDDDQAAAELVVGLGRLLGRGRDDPVGDGDPGGLEQILRLVLVDFHGASGLAWACGGSLGGRGGRRPSGRFYHARRGGSRPARGRVRAASAAELFLDLALDPGDLLVGRERRVAPEDLAGLLRLGQLAELASQ